MKHNRKTLFERTINSGKLLVSSEHIGVKFSRSPETLRNWGDALNSYLIPRLTGRKVLHVSEYVNSGLFSTVSAIGSVLDNNRTKNLHVWGSGFKSASAIMHVLPSKVVAVRGPLTRKRLQDLGVTCPAIYGDPALILSKYYQPGKTEKKFKVGIVPHYADKRDKSLQACYETRDVCFIDIESGIEEFVDNICSCEVIVSSSLHGLIAADAYRVPRVWLKITDKIAGGDFKFNDYFSTTDAADVSAVEVRDILNSKKLMQHAILPQRVADIEKLVEVFPSI